MKDEWSNESINIFSYDANKVLSILHVCLFPLIRLAASNSGFQDFKGHFLRID